MRAHIPKYGILHSHRRENFKSYKNYKIISWFENWRLYKILTMMSQLLVMLTISETTSRQIQEDGKRKT
jgi:hypothetical protein